VRVVPPRAGSVADAVALGPALLARAAASDEPWLGATVTIARAVLLGRAQRAGRVLRPGACERAETTVLRRATSGIAAHLDGKTILWALALPHVASLHPDATPRTILNRNVRGFLKGLARAGLPAAYFGRACISIQRRPAALLGVEMTAEGAVLLEVLAGMDAGLALPESIAQGEERDADHRRGPLSFALSEATRLDAGELAAAVMEVVAGVGHARAELVVAELPTVHAVTTMNDPMSPGFEPGPSRAVPIGWLETGVDASGSVWLGGDALAPAHVYAAIADGRDPGPHAFVEGATLEDLREAVRCARGAR
jgi:hypothetical protein